MIAPKLDVTRLSKYFYGRGGEVRKVLEAPNKPITHSYFIERGLASIVAGNSHKRLEVGLIGSEGMTGLAIVFGNDRSPHEHFIQVAGEGLRISADKLREAMRQSRSLENAFLRFAHSFLNTPAPAVEVTAMKPLSSSTIRSNSPSQMMIRPGSGNTAPHS